MEEWRDVEGFEGQYKVSSSGRVWSVSRLVRKGKTGSVLTRDMFLKPYIDQKGYVRVFLNENGKTRFIPVHRLVALAFIPNPDNKPQVNHIDGNKANNNVENLEWCTNSENQIHAYKHGLNYVTGRAGRKRIPVEMLDLKTKKTIKQFVSINEAARETGVLPQNIRKVVIGERDKAGGYGWRRVVI